MTMAKVLTMTGSRSHSNDYFHGGGGEMKELRHCGSWQATVVAELLGCSCTEAEELVQVMDDHHDLCVDWQDATRAEIAAQARRAQGFVMT